MKRLASILVVGLIGCGGDPADVAGNYTIAVTNRDNGCGFATWTVGQQATGILVTITQQSEDVSATIEGATGALVSFALGSNVYAGTVDGDTLHLTLFGSRPQTMGNCAYTYNSIIHATASGDALSGRIEYTAATNGNPDCATIEGCLTYQDFNGTRPPQ